MKFRLPFLGNKTETEENSLSILNESSEDTAKSKLKGIIRKGIVQRKAARRFARRNIQFDTNVDVYSRKGSIQDSGLKVYMSLQFLRLLFEWRSFTFIV